MSRQVRRFGAQCKPPPACITPTSSTSMTTDGPKTAPSITSWVPAEPVAGQRPTAWSAVAGTAIYLLRQACAALAEARGWSDPSRHPKAEQPVCLLAAHWHDVVKLLDFAWCTQSDGGRRTATRRP